jgi:prevent-host-death family protein
MKSAKISQLKANLSNYLVEVREGGSVVVYDGNIPIARLVPFDDDPDDLSLIEATAHPSSLKRFKGIRPKRRIDIDRVLRELRGDGSL